MERLDLKKIDGYDAYENKLKEVLRFLKKATKKETEAKDFLLSIIENHFHLKSGDVVKISFKKDKEDSVKTVCGFYLFLCREGEGVYPQMLTKENDKVTAIDFRKVPNMLTDEFEIEIIGCARMTDYNKK